MFREQKFFASTSISDIKYNHTGSQKDNTFYAFYDQPDYAQAHYFTDFKTTKGNVNRFLSNSLTAPFTKKLSYQNID